MSMSLRENITAVIETCFSETKDEIQDTAINAILELIRADRAEPLTLKGGEDVHEFCKKCGESKARLIGGERYIVCGKASDLVCVSMKKCPLGKWVCEDTYIVVP